MTLGGRVWSGSSVLPVLTGGTPMVEVLLAAGELGGDGCVALLSGAAVEALTMLEAAARKRSQREHQSCGTLNTPRAANYHCIQNQEAKNQSMYFGYDKSAFFLSEI